MATCRTSACTALATAAAKTVCGRLRGGQGNAFIRGWPSSSIPFETNVQAKYATHRVCIVGLLLLPLAGCIGNPAVGGGDAFERAVSVALGEVDPGMDLVSAQAHYSLGEQVTPESFRVKFEDETTWNAITVDVNPDLAVERIGPGTIGNVSPRHALELRGMAAREALAMALAASSGTGEGSVAIVTLEYARPLESAFWEIELHHNKGTPEYTYIDARTRQILPDRPDTRFPVDVASDAFNLVPASSLTGEFHVHEYNNDSLFMQLSFSGDVLIDSDIRVMLTSPTGTTATFDYTVTSFREEVEELLEIQPGTWTYSVSLESGAYQSGALRLCAQHESERSIYFNQCMSRFT